MRSLQEDAAGQVVRCEELGRQNGLLHQQMDQMASRAKHPPPAPDPGLSEEGKSSQQVLEILRYRAGATHAFVHS